MPPTGPGKRKRGDRSFSGDSRDEGQRPSPHRPANLNMAQHSNHSRDFSEPRGRGRGRGGRGGRGGWNSRQPSDAHLSQQQSVANRSPEPVEPTITNGDVMDSPVQNMNQPEPEPEVDGEPYEPKPYAYEFVTEDVVATWTDGGRDTMLSKMQDTIRTADEMAIAEIAQELVQSSLALRLPPTDAGEVVKQLAELEDRADEQPSTIQTAVMEFISVSPDIEHMPLAAAPSLRRFLIHSGIDADVLRRDFDGSLLVKLALLRDTFARMGIRRATNVLYKQSNYNLMREESEGFAKLMTELFTTAGNEPSTAEIVEDTVEKVKAMIGAFDLDVGRTLDVILDVFGALLVKQARFFVKFLRASPWWPRDGKINTSDILAGLPLWANRGNAGWTLTDEQREAVSQYSQSRDAAFWPRAREVGLSAFFELGRTKAPDELVEKANAPDINTTSEEQALMEWVKETGTLPPRGNRDAAQLLGFKLRFYSSSAARDENDSLPDNLIHLSALLIKIGFISLKDLYPHLWRSDEDMEQLRQQKIKDKADREREGRPGAGAKNALLMAGALADDTLPAGRDAARLRDSDTRSGTPTSESATAKPAPASAAPESADQKVALLKSLLAIGALPEALFILGRFPWILELYPEMPEYINRILHHTLNRVYGAISPLSSRSSLQELKPTAETDVPNLPKGHVRLADTPAPKVLKWAMLDRSDHNDGHDYRFYWEEWNDNVPVCQDIDDVFTLCQTFLNLVGVRIGQDAELLVKFARIGKYSMKQDDSEKNKSRWLDLSKRYLLPALSFTKSNAGVVNEVYELINNFPISTRYLMYLEWSTGRTSRLPEMKTAVEQARAETRDVLKRISKTNVKPMARQLAKVAYANPHIVITTAMSQIEAYDGIAEVFIEGVRYFTDLGYDVLTWAMISSMAREGRSRTQESGLFTSKWLIALASFGGKICKRYSMMKPGPILKYVADQLGNGNLTDLVMLEQIVLNMGGISTDTNYNDAQLQAMGGGELLQSQTILQLLDRRHEAKVTAGRLMRELRSTGLTGKLLISMAQQRQACIYDKENSGAPLKLLGNIFDEIHRIMIQYLDLLRTNLRVEDFRTMVPDVAQLLYEYNIRPEIAFSIARPAIRSRIIEFDKEEAERKKDEAATPKEVTNEDEEMEDLANGVSEEDGEAADTPDVTEGATPTPAAISNVMMDQTDTEAEAIEANEPTAPEEWHPVLKDIMDKIQSRSSPAVVDLVGVGFFTTFWQLSLYDIAVASDAYNDEIKRLTARVKAINADRSSASAAATREKEKQKKELKDLIDGLMSENRQHIKASNVLKKRLEIEKKQWFIGKFKMPEQLNTALMETCFLPRLLCSPIDAYFCFKFVKFLHSSAALNFRALSFYDLMFKADRLASLIFACTSNEADNFGRFLNEVLRDLARWHQSKSVYEKEAYGSAKDLPGFAMSVSAAGKVLKLLGYEDFRRILFTWHQKLHAALITCLSSPEYMHVRNAISILRAVSKHFPAVVFHGTTLRKSIEALADSDKEDLKLSSKAILSELNKREKAWVIPQAFRKGKEMEKPAEDSTARAATPQPAEQLNAEAPEFKPLQPPADTEDKKAAKNGEPKDITMEDVPSAPNPIIKKDVEQDSQQARATKESTPVPSTIKSEAVTEKATNNDNKGGTTPRGPASSAETRRGELPRRPSPVRGIRPSPSLPSRPDPADRRSMRRDDAHIPSRPPVSVESARHAPEPRLPESLRHGRPDDRSRDPHYDRSGPYPPRGLERDDRPPPPRGDYGRGSEREHSSRYSSDRGTSRPDSRDSGGHGPYDMRHDHARGPPDPRYERDRITEPRPTERPSSSAPPSSAQQPAVTVNPARAALIGADAVPPRDLSIKGQAQDRSIRGSRPTSPKPAEERRHHSRPERPDEPVYDRRVDPNYQPLGKGASPAGPRPTRQDRSGPFGTDSRPGPRPPVDMQHGRLEQEPSSAPPATSQAPDEAPSGPRGRGTNTAPRGRGEPMPPINTSALPSPNTIPTGPSRLHGRTSSHHESQSSAVPSSPAVPAPDTTGVHPSRLNLVASPTQEAPPRFYPQPIQAAIASSPPMGPRSAGGAAPANAPTGPSPTTRGPPSGPGMGNDPSARNGRNGRHPLTAVNNHLEQAGRGTSIRGRGSMRQNSQNGPVGPNMPPPSPASGYGQGPPVPQQPDSRRHDLFANDPVNGAGSVPNGPPPQAQIASNDRFPPSRPAPNDRRADLMDDRNRDDGRHPSRHSSRERGLEADMRESHRNGERGGLSGGYSEESRRGGRPRENEGPIRPDDGNIRSGGHSGNRGGYGHDRGGYAGGDRGGQGLGRGDPRGQKHGRDADVNPYPGPGAGRSGMRNASENKRVRRGG
jgi:THO complex subunit 2